MRTARGISDAERAGTSVTGWPYPRATPLSLKTTNGGITVDAVDSRVELKTTNGGVKLTRMAGDVEGHTTNGGIDVDLEGSRMAGRRSRSADDQRRRPAGGSELSTTRTSKPGRRNGNVRIDFPVTVQGTIGKSFSTDLGSGGATLRVRTSNGGVRVTKK